MADTRETDDPRQESCDPPTESEGALQVSILREWARHTITNAAGLTVLLASSFYLVGRFRRLSVETYFGIPYAFEFSIYDQIAYGAVYSVFGIVAFFIVGGFFLLVTMAIAWQSDRKSEPRPADATRRLIQSRTAVRISTTALLLAISLVAGGSLVGRWEVQQFLGELGPCAACFDYKTDTTAIRGLPIVADQNRVAILTRDRTVQIVKWDEISSVTPAKIRDQSQAQARQPRNSGDTIIPGTQ